MYSNGSLKSSVSLPWRMYFRLLWYHENLQNKCAFIWETSSSGMFQLDFCWFCGGRYIDLWSSYKLWFLNCYDNNYNDAKRSDMGAGIWGKSSDSLSFDGNHFEGIYVSSHLYNIGWQIKLFKIYSSKRDYEKFILWY